MELVILAPAFGLMIAFVVLAGRVQSGRADVEAAAHAAARTITLSRDPDAAIEMARAATAQRLDVGSPACRTMHWDAEVTDYEATVTVACDVDLSDLALLPVPGEHRISATSSEVVDQRRERGNP